MTRRERKEAIEFYIGISPWLIGLVFFTGGPILASFVISFTKWRLLSPPEWIGIENYIGMFQDEGTRVSLGVCATESVQEGFEGGDRRPAEGGRHADCTEPGRVPHVGVHRGGAA